MKLRHQETMLSEDAVHALISQVREDGKKAKFNNFGQEWHNGWESALVRLESYIRDNN